MKNKTSYLFIVFLGCILFQGCQEDEYVAGTTALDIKITDAPGRYDAIQLHVKEIEVKTSSDSFTIPVTVDAFNILDYQMGKSLSLVENFELPSERLDGVRLILHQEGSFVVMDSVSYPLSFPTPESPAWDIDIQDDLVPGVPYTLMLDFDAARSIDQTAIDEYVLDPVVRAFSASVSGAIRGKITPELAMPAIYLLSEKDTIAGTVANQQGEFYFPGVPDGTYRLEAISAQSLYDKLTMENVAISEGEVLEVEMELNQRDTVLSGDE